MKKIASILLLLGATAFAADTHVKGYLVDLACGEKNASKADFGATHTVKCMQMPDCTKSGYGVLTPNKKIVKFDKAGNVQARAMLGAVKKENNVRVDAIGQMVGAELKVKQLKLE